MFGIAQRSPELCELARSVTNLFEVARTCLHLPKAVWTCADLFVFELGLGLAVFVCRNGHLDISMGSPNCWRGAAF